MTFLGRGIVDGQYVADLWLLADGLIVACDPGTATLSQNPNTHRRWRCCNDRGVWIGEKSE